MRGHYLFREANSFPRAEFEENCELRRKDNIQWQKAEYTFKVNHFKVFNWLQKTKNPHLPIQFETFEQTSRQLKEYALGKSTWKTSCGYEQDHSFQKNVYWNCHKRTAGALKIWSQVSFRIQLEQYSILLKVQLWDWSTEIYCSLGLIDRMFHVVDVRCTGNLWRSRLHLKSFLLDFHQSAFFANLTLSGASIKVVSL